MTLTYVTAYFSSDGFKDVPQAKGSSKTIAANSDRQVLMPPPVQQQERQLYGVVAWKKSDPVSFRPNFSSSDIGQMYFYLANQTPADRDQFETTAQYQDRIEEAYRATRIGSFVPDDTFLFLGPVDNFLHYNADRGGYTLEIPASALIDRQETNLGAYTAQNAFGVTKNVEETKIRSYYLRFANLGSILPDMETDASDVTKLKRFIPIDPGKAEELKDDLRLAFLVHLKKPFVQTDSSHTTPEISNPVDETTENDAIVSELIEVDLVANSTGEIIGRVPVNK